MTEEKKPGAVTRRDFLKGIAVGAVATAAVSAGVAAVSWPAPAPPKIVTTTVTTTAPATTTTVPLVIPRSGVIAYAPEKCVGCERCVLACALVHGGAVAPQLSGIMWREEFVKEHVREPLFCQQCNEPDCYPVCPLKDKALCIDKTTGARYIDVSKCNGCGLCIKACPLTPPRINFDPERKVAIMCDLCKDRPAGPACIQVCATGSDLGTALSFIPKEAR